MGLLNIFDYDILTLYMYIHIHTYILVSYFVINLGIGEVRR